MNEEYLWNRSGEPDEEVVRLERLLAPLGHRGPVPMRRRSRSVWWLAAVAAAVVLAGMLSVPLLTRGPLTSWQLSSGNRLRAGQLIETGKTRSAQIESEATGEVRIDPSSRLRLVAANPGEERFSLERGTIHAFIWAPPGRFVVDTPSAKTIDLGCRYTLQVSQNGTGLLTVETGWVAFESHGVESFIPEGAACVTRPARGPGTPYFTDASQALTAALERFDTTSDSAALQQAVANTRARDALTLWHLLTRTRGERRGEVFDRFAGLVALPHEVSREAILHGDIRAFDAAWNALDLGEHGLVERVEKTMVSRRFFGLGLLVLWCVSAAETVPPENGLVVHEWETFTSVTDRVGNPLAWLPLATPSDLPCFVHRFDGKNIKVVLGDTVRMETPVLYFYAAHPLTADVKVQFTKGMITEWYPQASVKPSSFSDVGGIEWNSIALSQSRAALLREDEPSHYYAARETDSLTVETGGDHDRMIFYRGVGNFAIPLHPRVTPEGKVEMSDARAIVFESRGQNDGSAEVVRKELYAALVDSGLYPKEAHAMIETWRDSWFEEGLRVFYIVPRELVDSVLPITISPRPDNLVRTFVGRIELLAPWMREEIDAAMRTGDTETLARRGRFLRAFVEQMGNATQNPKVSEWLDAKENEGVRRFLSGACK